VVGVAVRVLDVVGLPVDLFPEGRIDTIRGVVGAAGGGLDGGGDAFRPGLLGGGFGLLPGEVVFPVGPVVVAILDGPGAAVLLQEVEFLKFLDDLVDILPADVETPPDLGLGVVTEGEEFEDPDLEWVQTLDVGERREVMESLLALRLG